jgi:hypothetical protein
MLAVILIAMLSFFKLCVKQILWNWERTLHYDIPYLLVYFTKLTIIWLSMIIFVYFIFMVYWTFWICRFIFSQHLTVFGIIFLIFLCISLFFLPFRISITCVLECFILLCILMIILDMSAISCSITFYNLNAQHFRILLSPWYNILLFWSYKHSRWS